MLLACAGRFREKRKLGANHASAYSASTSPTRSTPSAAAWRPSAELERRPGAGSPRSSRASVSTRTAPRRSIASRFERSTAPGSSGQGVSTTAADLEPGRPHRLDRQQGVVDRPEPRRRRRSPPAARGRGRSRGPGSRASAAPGSRRPPRRRAGRRPPPRPRPRARSRVGLDPLAGQLGGEVRRDRRAVAVRGDLVVGLRRARRRGAAARGRARRRSSSPLTAGLNTATRRPAAAAVRAIAAATTVLPTSVPVPVTKTPRPRSTLRRRAAGREPRRRRAAPGDPELARPRGRSPAPPRRSSSARWFAITVSRRRELPGGHGRRPDRLREDAALERALAERHRAPRVADDHRHDLGPRAAGVEPLRVERLAQGRRVAAQLLDQPGPVGEQRERRQRGADRRRRRRGREDERPRGVDQQLDDLGRGADVGAVAAERLAERADDDVDLAARARRRRPRRARPGRARRSPCASSTTSMQPWRRRAARPGRRSGATSPSIEKTPSVTISRARSPASRSPHSRCSRSRWR